MTEQSWLWDGTATGDASLTSYEKEAFNRWFISPRSNDDSNYVYVIPGFMDDLLIEANAAQTFSSILVRPGMAIVDNYIYKLDENKYFNVLQLAVSSYRYDSLVLRITRGSDPKVRLALMSGDESSTFPPPTYSPIQEVGGTWEIEIARILVDSAGYTIDGTKLEVFTRFIPSAPYYNEDLFNFLANSEIIVIGESGLAAGYIEGWDETISPAPTPAFATLLNPQTRGYAANVTNGGGYRKIFFFNGRNNNRITLEGVIKNNDADTRTAIRIEYYRSVANTLYESTIKDNDSFGFHTADTHYFKRTFSVPEDTNFIYVELTGTAVANDFDIGQILIAPGYFTGGHRPFHEYIPINYELADASWTGSAKSTGTTAIDLSASFGGVIPEHVKAVVLHVRCRDSASAAGVGLQVSILSYTSNWTYGSVIVDGIPNDDWTSGQIIAYIDEEFHRALSTTRGFRVSRTASGAGTMDITIKIVGVIV